MGKTVVDYIWRDRKRTVLGLPWSFTIYKLTAEKFNVQTGLFNTKNEDVRLYRILDLSLSRTFGQKMFGLGTIICNTADKTAPVLEIKNIKNSKSVMELLSEIVEKERERKRVSSREFMSYSHDEADYDEDDNHLF